MSCLYCTIFFAVPKNIRVYSTHYFIMKTPIKQELQKLHPIIHQILTLKTLWIFIKMYCEVTFFFSHWCYSSIRLSFSFQKRIFYKNIITMTMLNDGIRDEKFSTMILTERQKKYQHYYLEKLIKTNILQVKKYCLLIKDK